MGCALEETAGTSLENVVEAEDEVRHVALLDGGVGQQAGQLGKQPQQVLGTKNIARAQLRVLLQHLLVLLSLKLVQEYCSDALFKVHLESAGHLVGDVLGAPTAAGYVGTVVLENAGDGLRARELHQLLLAGDVVPVVDELVLQLIRDDHLYLRCAAVRSSCLYRLVPPAPALDACIRAHANG